MNPKTKNQASWMFFAWLGTDTEFSGEDKKYLGATAATTAGIWCWRRWEWGQWTNCNKTNKNNNQTSYVTGVWCFGSPWLIKSGAVIGDGDDGYGSWCVVWGDVIVLLLPSLKRGTYLGVCLWWNFVVRSYPQNILSTFIEPSAKPTRAHLLGTT
jgi:hypothetical protein